MSETTIEVQGKPILFSRITGKPSQRGKRLRSLDGLTWRERNREAVNARKRELYVADKTKHQARTSRYRKENSSKVNEYNRKYGIEYRATIRREMISAYGGECACCGEATPQFLQLDHVHNDGSIERLTYGTSTHLWVRLKRLGWPKDRYQLLCANCNFGKLLNGGLCPHKAQL